MLTQIIVPSSIRNVPIPEETFSKIDHAQQRIRTFQDRWDQPQIEQFVAADFEHVDQTLRWLLDENLVVGNRFLEWGCGFAVVSALAATLGFDAIGIEVESTLVAEGLETIRVWPATADIVKGNFLPPGSERLADDLTLPSLGHEVDDGYAQCESQLDDFALVYGYPWPGEEVFHQLVFDRYARGSALLMQFCGPNDIRLWRKTD